MQYTLTDVLLSLKDVSLSFKGNLVLRDINFEIRDIVVPDAIRGQITTLVGLSGIGKTQLLKMIAGLQTPTTGEIRIGKDQILTKPGIVGMVLQDYPLFKHYTVYGNLKLVNKNKEKIDFYLNEFSLWDHKDKYVAKLSGGQRQRTAVVQQLLCSDEFILLDEPFSGLDPLAIDKLCANIVKVANLSERNTIFISSHILSPSMAISDRIMMLGHRYTTDLPSHGFLALEPVKLSGATIIHDEDLAAQGLAWNPEIRKDHRFTDKVEEIRQKFHTS